MTRPPIPPNALDRHIAFLGATGSGKTSAAKSGIVEPALANGERVCIIDPTAAWWGLRIGSDGKKRGFSIYIFGGDHGDYPLRAADAGVLAEAFGTSSDSAIFDTSQMTVSERTAFFTEFAETIRRKNKGPLKLIIDEAHLFMPQAGAKAGGAVPAMLHAGNNLVSLGRSRGLRITLISQRPAKLHKDSLTQVQSIVAMRLLAPQDRKAISEWIADQADASHEKEIIASLPSLRPGEAWVWSPQDNYLERRHFPMPRTFDSSRADTTENEGPELSPINLDALKGRLATVHAAKEANDPKALRATIARLEREAAAKPTAPTIDPNAIAGAHQDGMAAGFESGWQAGVKALADTWLPFIDKIQSALPATMPYPQRPNTPETTWTPKEAKRLQAQVRQPMPVNRIPQRPRVNGADTGELPKGERACLIAIAMHPNGVTREQVTILTGYKRSTRDAYIQRLGEREYCRQQNGRIHVTEAGATALGDTYEPLPTGSALRNYWLERLPEGERAVLAQAISSYPDPADREDISTATGYKRSTRDAYIQRLATRELVKTERGQVTASDNLF